MLPRPKPAKTARQSYYFPCARCRHPIPVDPNQCGSKLDCPCGAPNVVPSLMDLKRWDGQPPGAPFAPPAPASASHPQHSPICPFCGRPMEVGRILGDRYRLKWLRADTALTLGIWALGGVDVGHGGPLTLRRPYVSGWRCPPCGRIIVDERAP